MTDNKAEPSITEIAVFEHNRDKWKQLDWAKPGDIVFDLPNAVPDPACYRLVGATLEAPKSPIILFETHSGNLYNVSPEYLPAPSWGIWCSVSGGITGTNTAWLKAKNPRTGEYERQRFYTQESAEYAARKLRADHSGAQAVFSYIPREIG